MAAPPLPPGLEITLVWTKWLADYVKNLQLHIDPYLLWSLQTHFRQNMPKPVVIDFLLELDEPLRRHFLPWGGDADLDIDVPPIYYDNLPGGAQPARHVTVRLNVKGLDLDKIMNKVGKLLALKGVVRTQIGFPRPPLEDDRPGRAASAVRPVPVRAAEVDQPWPEVVLAVLDDACPFGHPALLSQGRTRVAALWDQSLCNEKEQEPPLLGYGREQTGNDLDHLLHQHSEGGVLDEESLYRDRAAWQLQLHGRSSHAAAVATLLAGRRSLLPSHPISTDPPATETETVDLGEDGDDAASRAPLVVVQFPREQINLTARWMVVRALDGLRYVAREAERLKGDYGGATLPLVANLSYGGVVGAHDGTALFETAMAELAQAHQRMAIVVAAGNAYGTRRDDGDDAADARQCQASGCHATGLLEPGGGTTSLQLCIAPNKPIETYLEMWFEDVDKQPGDEQFLEYHEVSIEAVPPVGPALKIDLPYADFDSFDPKKTCAGLIGLRQVAQSRLRSMALLVVAATQVSSTRVEVPSGIWRIRITNHKSRRLRVKAWVERDLLPGFAPAGQAARLLPGCEPGAARLSDDDTLNNIATGTEVFRVGALNWRGGPHGLAVSTYSSAAREDPLGPEFSAVADVSPLLPGIRVSGSISSAIVRMNGTSVAAPQAARYIANRLAGGDTLRQIHADIGQAHGDRRRGRILV